MEATAAASCLLGCGGVAAAVFGARDTGLRHGKGEGIGLGGCCGSGRAWIRSGTGAGLSELVGTVKSLF